MPPPPRDPILSFLHTFPLKRARVGGQCPHNGSMPPLGNPGSATDVGHIETIFSLKYSIHSNYGTRCDNLILKGCHN